MKHRQKRENFNKKKGFTLIELMVVVSIIAIVASVLYANFGVAKADGRNAKRAEDSVQLRNALTEYSLDNNGLIPAGNAAAGCTPVMNGGVQTSWLCNSTSPQGLSVVLAPLVSGKYISAIPSDPVNSGGLGYYYVTGLSTQTNSSGVALAPNASFRYVVENQSSGGSPVILGTDVGTPDFTDFPGSGYPIAQGGSSGGSSPSSQTLTVARATASGFSIQVGSGGAGSITSSPSGINCGSTCSAQLSGTVVLSASPSTGSTFDGWGGSCSGSGSSCTLNMIAAQSATAYIDPSWGIELGQNTWAPSAGWVPSTACASYGANYGGNTTGWHLPSQTEIFQAMGNQAYNSISFANNFIVGRVYWTSTAVGSQYATANISSGGLVSGQALSTTSMAFIKCVH